MSKNNQKGFVLLPVLYVIIILIVIGTTFYIYVRAQQKPVMHEQASITAKYVAESGFNRILSELSSINTLYSHPILSNSTRTSNTIILNTITTGNRTVEGSYVVKIEDGSILSTGKTVTGSSVQGYDKYGNPIWFDNTNKNWNYKTNSHRLGIEVKGYLTEKWGNTVTKKTGQGVYAIVEVPAPSTGKSEISNSPAKYLLSCNENLNLLSGAKWYGPMHTNGQIIFTFIGAFDPDDYGEIIKTYTRGNPANTAEIINYPKITVKQASTTYVAGTDYYLVYWNGNWYIHWGAAGAEPIGGTTYTVEYGYEDPIKGKKILQSLVRGTSPNTADIFNFTFAPTVKQGNTTYTIGTDFNFTPWGNPQNIYLDWAPTGLEPAVNSQYTVSYTPHSKIEIYGPLTYSGSSPLIRYFHEHRAPGSSLLNNYRGAHGHTTNTSCSNRTNPVWGANLDCNEATSTFYEPWPSKKHYHTISTDLINSPPSPDTYFLWGNNSYKPSFKSAVEPPVLYPNNLNYYRQREQLNKVLSLTLKQSLQRDNSGYLQLPSPAFTSCCPSPLPCPDGICVSSPVSCPEQGYYEMNGGVKDFRAYYFGNNLKYTAGSKIGQPVPFCYYKAPPIIWVNDTPGTPDYMKVADTQINSNYHYYTYFEIPKNGHILDTKGTGASFSSGVILVKDGIVKIGNYKPKDPAIYCADCITTSTAGNSTIIDGRLTIISYSETKPTNYNQYNPGDIIVIGNVVYRNGLYSPDNLNWRQYDFTYQSNNLPYTPSSLTDPNIKWVTNTDGSPVIQIINGKVSPVGNVNGLALIASNDIKFITGPYWASDASGNDKTFDTPQINGQMLAGRLFGQFPTSSNKSNQDNLYFYGSIYSYEAPITDYFQGGRYFFLDKSLFIIPLLATPFFPQDSTYKSQHLAGTSLINILPGTWRQIPAN